MPTQIFLDNAGSVNNKHYGSFYADGNGPLAVQNPSGSGVEDFFKFDTNVTSSGINLFSQTEIQVSRTAVYNIQFSAQLSKTTGTTDELSIWLTINGLPIDNTNTKITMANNNVLLVAAWNWMSPLNINDKISISWSTSGGHIFLYGEAGISIGGTIPPVILTINQVS